MREAWKLSFAKTRAWEEESILSVRRRAGRSRGAVAGGEFRGGVGGWGGGVLDGRDRLRGGRRDRDFVLPLPGVRDRSGCAGSACVDRPGGLSAILPPRPPRPAGAPSGGTRLPAILATSRTCRAHPCQLVRRRSRGDCRCWLWPRPRIGRNGSCANWASLVFRAARRVSRCGWPKRVGPFAISAGESPALLRASTLAPLLTR